MHSFCMPALACMLLAPARPSHGTQNPAPAALPAGAAPTPGAAPATNLPSDPGELFLLAAKLNRLNGEDTKPWHLKASYSLLDEKGAVKEQGTIEELWAGPNKERTTYTVGSEFQTTYQTDQGNFRAGTLAQTAGLVMDATREFVRPLPGLELVQHPTYISEVKQVGDTKLNCLTPKAPQPQLFLGMYCLGLDKPILRLDVSYGPKQSVRNQIVLFQGRYVPKDIRITDPDKSSITVHLDSLAVIDPLEEAEFTPPADARPMPKKIAISSGVATGLLLKQVKPVYPEEAKRKGVTGTVVMQAKISATGHILELRVVQGPVELQQAALDSVRQWVYKPYVLNGEKVEVDTTINVIFSMERF